MAKLSVKKEKEDTKAVGNSLETRVTRLEAMLRKLKTLSELHFGVDIDKDGKVGGHVRLWAVLAVAMMFVASIAFAGSRTLWGLLDSGDNSVITVTTDDDGTGDLEVVGDTKVSWLQMPFTALNVTNNQTLVPGVGIYLLNGTGQTNDAVNTLTLLAATGGISNFYSLFIVNAASTNLIKFVDSAPLYSSGNSTLDNNDNLWIYSVDTNVFVEISEVNN